MMTPHVPAQGVPLELRLSIRGVPCWVEIAWPVTCVFHLWAGSCPENIKDPLLKAEANSDETNSLTTFLTPGRESFECKW